MITYWENILTLVFSRVCLRCFLRRKGVELTRNFDFLLRVQIFVGERMPRRDSVIIHGARFGGYLFFPLLFGNITARRTIAEREIKYYFIARRFIVQRAIELL